MESVAPEVCDTMAMQRARDLARGLTLRRVTVEDAFLRRLAKSGHGLIATTQIRPNSFLQALGNNLGPLTTSATSGEETHYTCKFTSSICLNMMVLLFIVGES